MNAVLYLDVLKHFLARIRCVRPEYREKIIKRLYADIEDIQWSMTAILNIISTDKIKMFFNSLLDRSERCIESKRGLF